MEAAKLAGLTSRDRPKYLNEQATPHHLASTIYAHRIHTKRITSDTRRRYVVTEQPPGVGPEPGGYGYSPPPPPPPGDFNVSPSGGLGPPQQAGYPPPPLGANGSNGTNRFAIFSLISSAVGWVCCGIGSIAGIILGVMALKRIKQTNEGGRGLAIAGIIIGSFSLAALALFWGGFFVAAYNDHSKNTHHQDGQSAAVITAVPQAVSGISLA